MLTIDEFNSPGEHSFFFKGAVGELEAILTVPVEQNNNYLALLGHPNSLQGGTMNHKVVTILARAFKEAGINSIRFNFRGVGQSQGVYDTGIGESEDMLILMQQCARLIPEAVFLIAGFSFGAYVAYRTAAQSAAKLLITIAPSVHRYNYQEFSPVPLPWYILQGDEDELVSSQLVQAFADRFTPALPVIHFANTGHFFHGKLLLLKDNIITILNKQGLIT